MRLWTAALPQRLGQRHEVVIVHPDDVVGLQHLVEFGGEMLIDAEIAAEVAAGEFRQVQPVMEDGPQHPVGEAVVVFLVVLFARSVTMQVTPPATTVRVSIWPTGLMAPLHPSQTQSCRFRVAFSATSSPPG